MVDLLIYLPGAHDHFSVPGVNPAVFTLLCKPTLATADVSRAHTNPKQS